jgi:hypothetical protein
MAQVETQGESKATSITETTFEDPKKEEVDATEATDLANMDSAPTAVKEETIPTEKEAQAKLDAEEDMQYPHGLKLVVILAALCLSVFLVALDQTIIATAIPKITDHFNSIKDIGWSAHPPHQARHSKLTIAGMEVLISLRQRLFSLPSVGFTQSSA